MSTTVTFAGTLTDDPELPLSGDSEPFTGDCVAIGRRIEIEAGEWFDGELAGPNATIYGTAATHCYYAAGRSNPVIHGQLQAEARCDGKPGEKRPEQAVTVDNRFGEADLSLKFGAGRLGRQTTLAATTEN